MGSGGAAPEQAWRARPRPAEVSGPLDGVRVVELAALGPVPFGAMLLADLGADVLRIDRPGGGATADRRYVMHRGRRSIAVDLKQDEGREVVLQLIDRADAFLE